MLCCKEGTAESVHVELHKIPQNCVVLPGGRLYPKVSYCTMILWNRNDTVRQWILKSVSLFPPKRLFG